MKFIAEITNVSPSDTDELRVTFSSVRKVQAPEWRGFCPGVQLDVPRSQAHNFVVGRKATMEVELERLR